MRVPGLVLLRPAAPTPSALGPPAFSGTDGCGGRRPALAPAAVRAGAARGRRALGDGRVRACQERRGHVLGQAQGWQARGLAAGRLWSCHPGGAVGLRVHRSRKATEERVERRRRAGQGETPGLGSTHAVPGARGVRSGERPGGPLDPMLPRAAWEVGLGRSPAPFAVWGQGRALADARPPPPSPSLPPVGAQECQDAPESFQSSAWVR